MRECSRDSARPQLEGAECCCLYQSMQSKNKTTFPVPSRILLQPAAFVTNREESRLFMVLINQFSIIRGGSAEVVPGCHPLSALRPCARAAESPRRCGSITAPRRIENERSIHAAFTRRSSEFERLTSSATRSALALPTSQSERQR
jgi:hypothetical protein